MRATWRTAHGDREGAAWEAGIGGGSRNLPSPTSIVTAGGFFGLRIGDQVMGVSPELGVFYDRSALGLREGRVIYVPALTVHGDALARILPRW